jgi:myo-inositol-1(or 4)-monophosphatase
MRSANLNIIIKSLEKSTAHVSRDFVELENLQSNPASAAKFTEACYRKIKNMMIDDLSKIRPNYDLIFSDGEKIIRGQNSEYAFLISVIDGLENLLRSNPDFTSSIAVEHRSKDGIKKEVIAVAILKIVGSETYYCEKGFGAFLNNRRIRVSKRTSGNLIASTEDQNLVDDKKLSLRNYGCRSMEVAYVASSRIEKAFFDVKNNEFLKPFFLLIKEAGGKVIEGDKSIILSN